MDVNEIKALISPNRPGGVSALELEKASRLIDELDDLARQTVTGCVDIARRERARAEAAEAEVERSQDELNVARDLLRGVVDKPMLWYEDICDYLEMLDA